MTDPAALTFRVAGAEDLARIDQCLTPYAATSMFLRSNLARHGLAGGDAPHATSCILAEVQGAVRAVFGLSNSGYLMAQMPDPVPDLSQLGRLWANRQIRGMTGVATQVGAVLAGLGLGDAATQVDRNEPLYDLDLAALDDPAVALRRATAQDQAWLTEWFKGYQIDTGLQSDAQSAAADAKTRATHAASDDTMRIMEVGGTPVAMAALNAKAVDTVQVGGVYVPPGLRNLGYGRQVVAGLLSQARARGMTRAILFAASPQAARAYEGLGFRLIGEYRIVLLQTPTTIRPAP